MIFITFQIMNVRIDHLVYVAPELQMGIELIHGKLGVAPVFTGQHLQWGTHNALLALGDRCFFEVIAPDPSLAEPPSGLLWKKVFALGPHLYTWVMQCSPLTDWHRKFQQHDIEMGDIVHGSRKKPEGGEIAWTLTDPKANRLNGAAPFLIDWGTGEHPSASLPNVGSVIGIKIFSPDDTKLKSLGINKILPVDIVNNSSTSIQVDIELTSGQSVVIQ